MKKIESDDYVFIISMICITVMIIAICVINSIEGVITSNNKHKIIEQQLEIESLKENIDILQRGNKV